MEMTGYSVSGWYFLGGRNAPTTWEEGRMLPRWSQITEPRVWGMLMEDKDNLREALSGINMWLIVECDVEASVLRNYDLMHCIRSFL